MERHHSKTIAPTTVCRELLSNRNSDEMAGIVVGDARLCRADEIWPEYQRPRSRYRPD